MTRSVPWRVQKVEASIAEEVESREISNFEIPVEFDLSHLMTTEVLSVSLSFPIQPYLEVRLTQNQNLAKENPVSSDTPA